MSGDGPTTAGRGAGEVRRVPFAFDVREGDPLRGDLWVPERRAADVGLVVCHGFKGFKDWGFFPHLSRQLALRTGFLTASMNFTGCGIGEDPERFTELDRFARNTIGRELEDLEAVMDRLAAGRAGEADFEPVSRFGLFGHSRGGATVVLKAAARRQVEALVTWSAVAELERYEQRYMEQWEAGETAYVHNARTGQDMPLRRNLLDDLRGNRGRRDVLRAARTLATPWLVVHGEADEGVPVKDARQLAEAAGGNACLEIIPGAGHTLEAGHPFEGSNPKLDRGVELTAAHFREALAGETT